MKLSILLCVEKSIHSNAVENDSFLHQDGEGTLTLKENHAYLYQVQMQMRFADPQYCDFIVWKKGSYL